eukprot:CAMPEP_0184675394 /NCGR_PEP_ID=MMETSP0308-20130426/87763_1 /TAXON_ID=38269 /ORGANISM="Gloeochaete witrockiana, Strain SAG 46.84" /LENGTH=156 /DNA_ID=CAMNT_0027123093 /DNA_START=362 /DNA_END=832 /DNA_ORIENTATION=-
MDTLVEVENPTNGRSVVVRVNDRGPFFASAEGVPRILDLSHSAAQLLSMIKPGICNVNLRVMKFPAHFDREAGLAAYRQYCVQLGAYFTADQAERRKLEIESKCEWAAGQLMVDKMPFNERFSVITKPDFSKMTCDELAKKFTAEEMRVHVRNFRK